MPSDVSSEGDQQSFSYITRSGIAGGVAGCVAKTVVAPLDRVKILFQTSNPDFQKYAGTWSGTYHAGVDIYKQNGVRGLFQGHSATLLRVFPYAAIKYMAYDQVHFALMPTRESETNFRRFCAGSISGTISVCFTYPLELIRVRLAYTTRSQPGLGNGAAPSRPALRATISDIYRESEHFKPTSTLLAELTTSPAKALRAHLFYHFPVLSFYRGFTATLMGMVPYAGTSFLTWGYLRAVFLPQPVPGQPKPTPTPVADLAIGALAGSISQTISYPLEVVRRRMQVGGIANPDPRAWLTFGETVRRVWRAGGARGFYVGLTIGYAKVVPMTATSFAVWQWGKRLLDV
ncbi:mitochondrial carrier [Phellopilus nigrolimitatus]|nr:mitochondrial carrier [Phellopilus nigrolimitatus]